MNDPRIDKLAEVLVNYSVAVQPGERTLIQGPVAGAPLLKAVYGQVLRAGGHPLMMVGLPGTDELMYNLGSDEQLQHVPEVMDLVIREYETRIAIMSSENTRALNNVDPSRMVIRRQAQAELFKVMLERIASGDLRWVGTLFPTNAYAQDAEMSLNEYADFVLNACLPDPDDPVGYWQRFSAWQQKIVDWFAGKDQVRVVAPGTDLRLSIAGRTFMNCDGRQNMPDGEVCLSPVEDSVEGHVSFTYPTIYQGRELTGVQLSFEGGRAVKASAEKNEPFLLQTLDTDDGARYLGEFAIGTNVGITRFTGETLFDEKIGGSFHLALGAGLPETGGQNDSGIHWDMVSDLQGGGEIWVDGELAYKDGAFVIEF